MSIETPDNEPRPSPLLLSQWPQLINVRDTTNICAEGMKIREDAVGRRPNRPVSARAAFDAADANNDGFLDRGELAGVMQVRPPPHSLRCCIAAACSHVAASI